MTHSDAVSVVPTKILVPIDFSPSSHLALESAAELAEKFKAELLLVHCVPEYSSVVLPESVSEASVVEAAKKAALERFAVSKAALDGKGIKVSTHVSVTTDVAGCIVDTIEREHVDLMVLTTHGLSGWYPQVFGSIAEKLVKLSPCPLLLLRSPKPESSSTAKASYGRMMEWW